MRPGHTILAILCAAAGLAAGAAVLAGLVAPFPIVPSVTGGVRAQLATAFVLIGALAGTLLGGLGLLIQATRESPPR